VYITNLEPTLDQGKLEEVFGHYGVIRDTKLGLNQASVTLSSEAEAGKAVKLVIKSVYNFKFFD